MLGGLPRQTYLLFEQAQFRINHSDPLQLREKYFFNLKIDFKIRTCAQKTKGAEARPANTSWKYQSACIVGSLGYLIPSYGARNPYTTCRRV